MPSALQSEIQPKIESFLRQYTAAHSQESLDQSDMIAKACSYGVALAMSSQLIHAGMKPLIVPPPVPPSTVTVGLPVFGALLSQSILSVSSG